MYYRNLPSKGWLTEEEAALLWNTASCTKGPILEVGSYYGKSTCLLAQLGRIVYAVDPFDNFDTADMTGNSIYLTFLENLAARSITNVFLYKQKIEEWDILPVEFAYLDGDHTCEGTMRQLDVAYRAGAKLICVHDYCNDGGGKEVVKAVDGSNYQMTVHIGRMAKCELVV